MPALLRRRSLPTVVFLCIVSLVAFLLIRSPDRRTQYDLPYGYGSLISDYTGLYRVNPCPQDLDYLRRPKYDFTRQLRFQRICVFATASDDVDRSEVVNITSDPIGTGKVLDLNNKCQVIDAHGRDLPTCEHTINIKVSKPYPTRDFKDVLFVVATSADRLRDSLPTFSHWLGDTNAKLLSVTLNLKSSFFGDMDKSLIADYAKAGVNLLVTPPYDPSVGVGALHFTMIREALQNADANTKWIAILDDDTFFPSLNPIRDILDKLDPSEMVYAGAVTENRAHIDQLGHFAFGGAGIFISRPLAVALEPHIEECFKMTPIREGDGLLNECIKAITNTTLTNIKGMHQLDAGGNLDGFYESGELPISLHHWKSWHRAPVAAMAAITKKCGDCFLQRWRLGEDAIFTNGFTISLYRDGTGNLDLSKIEPTWDGAVDLFSNSMGPFRDIVPKEDKKSFQIIDSEELSKTEYRQLYKFWKAGEDELVEMLWKFI